MRDVAGARRHRATALEELQVSDEERRLQARADHGLVRCDEPVEEDGESDDRVAMDDDPVAGHQLVIGRRVAAVGDRGQVDRQDLLAAGARRRRPDQPDVLGRGRGQQAAGVLQRVEHGLVARDRQLAREQDVAEDVVVLAVVRGDVHEDAVGIPGILERPAWSFLSRLGSPVSSSSSTSPRISSLRYFRRWRTIFSFTSGSVRPAT